MITNNGTNLLSGARAEFSGDQLNGCLDQKLDAGANISIVADKPGTDGWLGVSIE